MKLYLAQCCTHPSYVSIFSTGIARKETAPFVGGGENMNLYLAGISIAQTKQMLFERERESMKLYLAGEHDVKNGRARYNGGGVARPMRPRKFLLRKEQ